MALLAKAGVEVTIATMTHGELGFRFRPNIGPGEPLAKLRARELAESCETIGAEAPVLLDFPDGGLQSIPPNELDGAILDLLRTHNPSAVITLAEDGVYGHLDHIATTAAVLRTTAALDTERPTVLRATFPRGLFYPIWKKLRRYSETALTDDVDAGAFGANSVDFVVDTSRVRDVKAAAVSCHRSQFPPGKPFDFLQSDLLTGLLDREWFCATPAPPSTNRPRGLKDLLASLQTALV